MASWSRVDDGACQRLSARPPSALSHPDGKSLCAPTRETLASEPLQKALRGILKVPVFPVAGPATLMGDGADRHQVTSQPVDQCHAVVVDEVLLLVLLRIPGVGRLFQILDRLVESFSEFAADCGLPSKIIS